MIFSPLAVVSVYFCRSIVMCCRTFCFQLFSGFALRSREFLLVALC